MMGCKKMDCFVDLTSLGKMNYMGVEIGGFEIRVYVNGFKGDFRGKVERHATTTATHHHHYYCFFGATVLSWLWLK